MSRIEILKETFEILSLEDNDIIEQHGRIQDLEERGGGNLSIPSHKQQFCTLINCFFGYFRELRSLSHSSF